MEYQKKILGIFLIIAGTILIVILTLLTSLLFALPVDFFFYAYGNRPEMEIPSMFRLVSLAGSLMLFLLIVLPFLIIGIGLIRQKRWADDLILPMGCFYLLFFPLGTAIGIYGLVVFFANRREPDSLFTANGDSNKCPLLNDLVHI
jgi:hypothetical protein